jgi:hypothetical protein
MTVSDMSRHVRGFVLLVVLKSFLITPHTVAVLDTNRLLLRGPHAANNF